MKPIVYSLHLQFRLGFRQIPQILPKKIFLASKERYFDNQTQKFIAINTTKYKGKLREMALTYEETNSRITLITIHPLKNSQKLHRIKSGRWLKI
jgi:hypothetical protein